MSDAYSGMLQLFGQAGAAAGRDGALRLYLATVLTPDPLAIRVCGIPIRAQDGKLWGNAALDRQDLAAGDTLLVLSPDQQTFYILAKEVLLS